MPATEYVGSDVWRKGQRQHFIEVPLPKFGTLNDIGTASGVTLTDKQPVMRESVVIGGCVSVETVGVDADGDISLYLCKYDAAANAEVVLSEALDAQSMTTKETSYFVIDGDLTDAEQTVLPGDTLYAKAVNDSAAIDTQPTNLAVTIDLARRR